MHHQSGRPRNRVEQFERKVTAAWGCPSPTVTKCLVLQTHAMLTGSCGSHSKEFVYQSYRGLEPPTRFENAPESHGTQVRNRHRDGATAESPLCSCLRQLWDIKLLPAIYAELSRTLVFNPHMAKPEGWATPTHVHTLHMNTHTNTRVYTQSYIHIRTHTYTYAHNHIYIHIHKV